MKKNTIWKILMFIGICPFVVPVVLGAYTMIVETSWTWVDWLVMYSFLYWPTYIVGAVLIILSVCRLVRHRSEDM